jgi:hypothetical protein
MEAAAPVIEPANDLQLPSRSSVYRRNRQLTVRSSTSLALCKQEVAGSIPVGSTRTRRKHLPISSFWRTGGSGSWARRSATGGIRGALTRGVRVAIAPRASLRLRNTRPRTDGHPRARFALNDQTCFVDEDQAVRVLPTSLRGLVRSGRPSAPWSIPRLRSPRGCMSAGTSAGGWSRRGAMLTYGRSSKPVMC